jgi:hypothetical protein
MIEWDSTRWLNWSSRIRPTDADLHRTRVGPRVAIQPAGGPVLVPVLRLQQVLEVAAQLASQRRREDPLGHPAEDQDDLGGPAVGPCKAIPAQALKVWPQAAHW